MVLDPLTALSVAGTIVQFVDFSSKVLSHTAEFYNSAEGALSTNEELELVTADLSNLLARLRRPLYIGGATNPPTQADQALQDLCDGCQKLANELLESLNGAKVKAKKAKWQSFLQAMKATWSEEDRSALVDRLAMFRGCLEIHILIGLREKLDLVSLQLSTRYDTIDERTQDIIVALLDNKNAISKNQRDHTMALTRELKNMEVILVGQQNQARDMIIDTLKHYPRAPERNIAQSGKKIDFRNEETEKSLLESLEYQTMVDRQEEIAEAYTKTFDWIFCDDSSHQQNWSNFVDWLQYGGGIYWVNGKAGSGKSTLMRYIYHNSQTRGYLTRWAAPSPLGVAAFFFWNSGTVEQRSQIGLLRSLIFEILRQHRKLIPIVLPWHWGRRRSQLLDPSGIRERDEWTLPKLVQAFKKLIQQDTVQLKLCLFIDGLDEYDGDHLQIAQMFQDICSSPNVKVCISSRPLLVFKNAFGDLPGLRLQDLTYDDIQKYVAGNLGKDSRYQRLALKEPERAPALVNDIVSKADGVFLWVTLVVKSLLSGLGNRDGIIDLQRRLLLLPSDLESLYRLMLSRIEPLYQSRSSEIFQIFHANWMTINDEDRVQGEPWLDRGVRQEPLTALTLSLAADDDSDVVFRSKVQPLGEEEILDRCQTISDHLNIQCAGLLEIQGSDKIVPKPDSKVQWLHRSVRDYLEKPEVWDAMLWHTAKTQFNPYSSLLGAYILELKIMTAPRPLLWTKMTSVLTFACHADFVTNRSNASLLEELEHTIAHHELQSTNISAANCTTNNGPTILNKSFLSVAVQFCLCTYVEEQLRRKPKLIIDTPGRPLLDFAASLTPRHPFSAKMVALLLRHGANPNQMVDDCTVWQNTLRWQVYREQAKERFYTGRIQDALEGAVASEMAEMKAIFGLMIEHGADANVSVICRYGESITPLFVAGKCFPPDEAKEIRELLKRHGCKHLSPENLVLDDHTSSKYLRILQQTRSPHMSLLQPFRAFKDTRFGLRN